MKSLLVLATLLVATGEVLASDSLQPQQPAIVTIPDDVTPDMLLQLGEEPAEWEFLDSLSRPALADVAACRDNFMPTWTLGGCRWIKDESNCTESGMFWFNAEFSNVYALCAWDGTSCAFDRDGATTCSVTFWTPETVTSAPAAAPVLPVVAPAHKTMEKVTVDGHEIKEPLLKAMVKSKSEKTVKHVTTPSSKASKASKATKSSSDVAPSTPKSHPVAAVHAQVAKPVHKVATMAANKSEKKMVHKTLAKTAAKSTAKHQSKVEEVKDEEEPVWTDEGSFLEMLSARQDAANAAVMEDNHENLLNAVDTNALQQHYLQNNNIAQRNLDNTATGLSNLNQNVNIQKQNDLVISAWSQGLTDPDLPASLDGASLSSEDSVGALTPDAVADALIRKLATVRNNMS
jgi:hypothetical protein